MSQLPLLLAAPPTDLNLPERVRVLSLWRRWAEAVAAVADGHPQAKDLETRDWPFPYPSESYPSRWVVIHAAQRFDHPLSGRIEPFPTFPSVEPGALCALVWVARCRPLLPEDRARALVYREGLWAWELERVHRLAPVKMRGPQKWGSVERAVVLDALARAQETKR